MESIQGRRPSKTPCPKCGEIENWELDYTGTLWCTDCSIQIEKIEGLAEKEEKPQAAAQQLAEQVNFLLARNQEMSVQLAKTVMLLLEYEQRINRLERDIQK
jgi:uncharacterized Zn finger protein (UPF0148 family)